MASETEWQDPFLRTPGQSSRSSKPPSAPPPAGARFDGPPPSGYYGTPGAGTASVQASTSGLPDWIAAPKWKRTWRVTMKRWGVAWCVVLPLTIVAANVAIGSYLPDFGYWTGADQTAAGLTGVMCGYLVWVAWWLDHVLARFGARVVHITHTVATTLLALIYSDSDSWLPLWFLPLVALVVTPLAILAAQKVKGSFAGAEPDVAPWSPPPVL